jgi:cell division septal protein FtsQ
MTRRARLITAVGVLLGAILLLAAAPVALKRLDLFRVREIEITGLTYLAPESVLAALRMDSASSVFQNLDVLADRVRGVSGVADVRIARSLPGRLRIKVIEIPPVAFVPTGRGLMVVDADGKRLPFDPTRPGPGLDLPVAASTDPSLLALLSRVAAVDPELYQQVTIARRTGSRGARDCMLELGSRRVWFRLDAGAEVIEAVVRVAEDLAARGRPFGELDARYGGQIVVRRRAAA